MCIGRGGKKDKLRNKQTSYSRDTRNLDLMGPKVKILEVGCTMNMTTQGKVNDS